MRRFFLPRPAMLALPVALALAGCGGSSTAASTSTVAAPDPARALSSLIDASGRGDDGAVRALLAPGSSTTASALDQKLGSFADTTPRTLYRGGDWAVVVVSRRKTLEGALARAAYAAALRLIGGRWRADLASRVRVEILGPQPGSRAGVRPQLGVEMRALAPLVETGLWLDGRELLGKGGGSPTRGTIYGVPDHRVRRGVHVAVAYARTGVHGSAVAWVFRV